MESGVLVALLGAAGCPGALGGVRGQGGGQGSGWGSGWRSGVRVEGWSWILTAVEFVALVQTVVVSVTHPVSGHTATVSTAMLFFQVTH